jgi:hypothetical protein
MFGGDVTSAGQVGDGSGELADFVVGAGTEAEFLHGLPADSIISSVQKINLGQHIDSKINLRRHAADLPVC